MGNCQLVHDVIPEKLGGAWLDVLTKRGRGFWKWVDLQGPSDGLQAAPAADWLRLLHVAAVHSDFLSVSLLSQVRPLHLHHQLM